jgi:hypothetical protein
LLIFWKKNASLLFWFLITSARKFSAIASFYLSSNRENWADQRSSQLYGWPAAADIFVVFSFFLRLSLQISKTCTKMMSKGCGKVVETDGIQDTSNRQAGVKKSIDIVICMGPVKFRF